MREVEDKVAFVTGGGSGIGLGMVTAFLEAGMKVVVGDLRREYLEEAAATLKGHTHCRFVQVDVADRADMARAADEAEAQFGKIHLLCNNAGVGAVSSVDDDDFVNWDWLMGINFGGVVNGVKAFMPKLRAHGERAHIVNTASMAAFLPLADDFSAYSTSKAAVRGLTEALRITAAPHNIGVSLLCPATTRSRAMQNLRLREEPAAGEDPREAWNLADGMDPLELGRFVLDGIRRNDAHIFAGMEFRDELAERFAQILADFSADREVEPARLAAEEGRRAFTAQRLTQSFEP